MPHLPLDINYITDEIILKAERELRETPTGSKKALEQFRKVIEDEPSLTCITDDDFLMMFLRSRKFNVKKAMDALKSFYSLKSNNKDILGDFNLGIAEKLIKEKVITILPYRDHDGCPIVIIAFDNFDFEEIDFSDFITTMALIEVLITDISPMSQICGLKFIEDMKILDFRHMKYITPRYFLLIARAMTGALPIRYKSVHVTNASSAVVWMWNISKFLVSKKLRDRCHFHNTADLKKFFDPALLPEEYGGALDYDNEFFIKILRSKEDRIHQINSGSYDP